MTKKAKKLFDFLKKYIEKNGIAPSFEEMKAHMELKSKASIFQYLEYLENSGNITRDKIKSRSIRINNLIPYFNEISAGIPLNTSSDNIEYIQINDLLKNKDSNCFACKVNGNSMESFGIFNNDIVIIDKNTSYNSKNIYAVEIDNNEITLKKIKLIDNYIIIEGDKNNYQSSKYNKDRIKIIGKMINLVRSY
ncbi:transcriptional repressor LexA [Alphaproteobacteria bacterium]|jgi:repressor LexA|nr:transcriptional repressor LexA [Alphaproteobacteria bacterium]MDC0968709.1 transcriptional repressor LexA [Alphaproteobacteria bacterium]|tara:strand:- start:695 stop:1273 length:579 start_codon:yes stop_codon:yes gene_type:complete